jgi:hypothetical protein
LDKPGQRRRVDERAHVGGPRQDVQDAAGQGDRVGDGEQVVLAMIPALQFRYWPWVSLAPATPVAVWGAWPFHRATLVNARHGVATMDTPRPT